MSSLATWATSLINPTPVPLIVKKAYGDTGLAVADPALSLAANADSQKEAQKKADAEARRQTAAAEAAKPKPPSPFATHYKSLWEL